MMRGADVAGRMAGEPTFPILYQVQAALGKSNLFLPPRMLTKNAFFTPLQVAITGFSFFSPFYAVDVNFCRLCLSKEAQGTSCAHKCTTKSCNALCVFMSRFLPKNSGLQDEVEIITALEDWGRVCSAMEVLDLAPEEEDSFWLLLAAITNLGFLATRLGQKILLIWTEPDSLNKLWNKLGLPSICQLKNPPQGFYIHHLGRNSASSSYK